VLKVDLGLDEKHTIPFTILEARHPKQVLHMSRQFPRRQPGDTLFGRAVAHRRQANSEDSLSYSDEGEEDVPHQEEEERYVMEGEESDGDLSDAGTIYSTNEAARRTPAQLKKEEMIKKQALLQELIQMKRDGVPLTREYTMDVPIELMNAEVQRYKFGKSENTLTGMIKVGINVGINGIEMLNQWKGKGWIPIKGWAKGMTSDMSIYDDPLRQLVRQQLARSGPMGNPWLTLGFMLIGSLIFHVMVAKMMHTENGSVMFVQMMKQGGIMGTLGNMSGMMNGEGGGVGAGTGMPQAVPNVGNPFANHNVPQVPPLHVPPPQPQVHPQQVPHSQPAYQYQPAQQQQPPAARPSMSGAAAQAVHMHQQAVNQPLRRPPLKSSTPRKKRAPMKRPSFLRPAHPPPSAPAVTQPKMGPVQVDSGMGSESTMNLDDE